MEFREISISWVALWRIFFFGLLVWLLIVAHEIFLGLFLAIVIAAALDRPVTFFEKKRIPRILSTLVIFIVITFVLALLIYTAVPLALAELNLFLKNVGKLTDNFSNIFNATGILQTVSEAIGRLTDLLFSGSVSFLQIVSKFFGGIIFAISVFVLSFYLTINRDGVPNFLVAVLPAQYEDKALTLYVRIRRKIGKWFNGQLFLSLMVGIAVAVGLAILGVEYSFLLGIVAGLAELVPFVGPIASGALAVMVGLTTSFSLGLYILIFFVVIQQIESNLLVPVVMKLTTSVNPVVVLVSILLGGTAFGFVGVILAVPAAVLFQEIIEDWSEEKRQKRASRAG